MRSSGENTERDKNPPPPGPVAGPAADAAVAVPVASLLPGDSPRLAGVEPDHVRLLAALPDLPPVLVHRRTMRVVDGMHRLHAARLRGATTLPATFFDGDEKEAFLRAVERNLTGGLPLSLHDREAAAVRILATYRQWSDRAVAAAAGLSPTTVGAIRRRFFVPAGGGNGDGGDGGRVGRDGRVRPLDASAGRLRASRWIARHPDAPLRAIARAAGISVGTAHDVRERLRAGRDPLPPRPALPDPRSSGPPRTRTTTGTRAEGWRAVRDGLARDPSIRYAESGRAFLAWADDHVLEPGDLDELADAVPPHWRAAVAEVARSCAAAWLEFARELEQRARTQPGSPD
ncbi:ParB/RepB/Spo0J family partition protein [Streptomyces sp. 184]|uniref:ParB/RepB/Spo0J family partition protein n=1 Tax=Streptomyces sp. 184 TaxID=1827526 RepID=UPI0038919D96